MANLLRDLQQAWDREGDSAEARAALARWATRHADLTTFSSPAELVRACHSRTNSRAWRLVDALTEEAEGDRWATRTVLQVVLPALATMARNHRDMARGGSEPFDAVAELDQFIICTAYERIPLIAAQTPTYRLRAIVDSTWSRLRVHAAAHRRDCDSRVTLDAAGATLVAPPARTDAEELALTLVDAVERRVLRIVDARLLYATRVAGHSAAELAEVLDWQTGSLLRRRHRVQQVMAAEVLGQRRPRHDSVAPAKASA